jgi:penicillin-binding protein 1B
VWVGFDDYSDLHLSGAQTAAPIWTEFMKKAALIPHYSDMKSFSQPSGVVDVQLDKTTNLLATPACPQTYTSAFIVGTEPTSTCDQNTGLKGVLSRIFGLGNEQVQPPDGQHSESQQADSQQSGQKKKGFFGKIAGIFKDDKKAGTTANPQSQTPDSAGH